MKLFIFESFCKQWIKAKNQMCLIVLQRTLFSDWPEDICRIYVFIHLSGFLYLFSLCLLYFFHWSNGARASSLQLHHQAISRFLHQQKVKVIYVPGIAHTLITSLNILHLNYTSFTHINLCNKLFLLVLLKPPCQQESHFHKTKIPLPLFPFL